MDRREFIKISGAAGIGALATGCRTSRSPQPESTPEQMEIRVNPVSGDKVSLLGFGCMRWPMIKDAEGKDVIDQEAVNEMVDYAIAHGVNYFDTSPAYLQGQSEKAAGIALSRHPRDSYYIADKFPGHSLPGPVDNIALFNISLNRCQTEYFDFYLLHNITEWSVKIYEDPAYHIMPDIFRMRDEGKIKHLGFSFHGGPELLEKFLTKYEGEFEFVQIQLNTSTGHFRKQRKSMT